MTPIARDLYDSVALGCFAQTLQGFRTRRRISKSALARLVGLHPSAINRFESGDRFPSRATIETLARVLAESTPKKPRKKTSKKSGIVT